MLRRICAERLGQSYANSLRIVLYRHLAGMPKSVLDQRRLGALARDFGLKDLVRHGRRSLRDRIAEAARSVSASESFRIDLARVALAKPDLVIIDTARLSTEPDQSALLQLLRDSIDSTIVVADREDSNDLPFQIQPLTIGKAASVR